MLSHCTSEEAEIAIARFLAGAPDRFGGRKRRCTGVEMSEDVSVRSDSPQQ